MSDFTKAPKQVLIDLINKDNNTSLTDQLISFGLPTAATGTNPTRNTDLTISAIPGSGYRGSVDLKYNRVQLNDFVGDKDLTFILGDATKLSDLIGEINALLTINLTEDDYQDVTLPAFQGTANETHEVQLVASSDSIVYLGSLTIKIKGEEIELGSVVTTRELSGLQAPAQSS